MHARNQRKSMSHHRPAILRNVSEVAILKVSLQRSDTANDRTPIYLDACVEIEILSSHASDTANAPSGIQPLPTAL